MNSEAGDVTELARAFGFDAAQLASNRGLELADGQTAELWPAVAFSVPLAVFSVVLGIYALRRARGALRLLGPLAGVGAASVLGVIVAYPSVVDLLAPSVAVVEGPIDDVSAAGKGAGVAVLHIRGLRILTSANRETVRTVLKPGSVYRVYHLPRTRRLLSLERGQKISQ